jgi:adenine-specific DNA-methyltransferase
LKRFLSELKDGMVPINLWAYKDVGTLDDGTKTVDGLLGKDIFDYPKPITLIQKMLHLSTEIDGGDIILDFFSGSATTAHAVMQLNAEDGGNRRFIVVQLPEITAEKSEAYKAGYKNICEIGKERIRRAGAKIAAEWQEKHTQSTIGEISEQSSPDTGFRTFKLDTSNLYAWDGTPISDGNLNTLWDRFTAREKTIKRDRSDLDIVFEVMLKMGIHLDYVVSEMTVGTKKCYSIGERPFQTSQDCLILVCLDFGITPEDITAFCDLAPAKIIAAEEAFEDSTVMSNAHYILRSRDIEMKLL